MNYDLHRLRIGTDHPYVFFKIKRSVQIPIQRASARRAGIGPLRNLELLTRAAAAAQLRAREGPGSFDNTDSLVTELSVYLAHTGPLEASPDVPDWSPVHSL